MKSSSYDDDDIESNWDYNTDEDISEVDDEDQKYDTDDEIVEGYVVFKAPCLIYNSGVTMIGKTTIIKDALLLHRFDPMPEKYILMLGALSESEHASKIEEMMRVIRISQPEMKKEDVHVVSSIEEGVKILNNMDPHSVKLFLVDDTMASKAGVDSVSLSAVGVHHQNLILIFNVQNLFVMNSRVIRENAGFLIIWPHYTANLLDTFFRQYPYEAKRRMFQILSSEGQRESDGLDGKIISDHNLSRIRTPVIIDKTSRDGDAVMKIYAGLFDSIPLEVPFISDRVAAAGGIVGGFKSFEGKKEEIFKDKSYDYDFSSSDSD